jgi:hypothetical protein
VLITRLNGKKRRDGAARRLNSQTIFAAGRRCAGPASTQPFTSLSGGVRTDKSSPGWCVHSQKGGYAAFYRFGAMCTACIRCSFLIEGLWIPPRHSKFEKHWGTVSVGTLDPRHSNGKTGHPEHPEQCFESSLMSGSPSASQVSKESIL